MRLAIPLDKRVPIALYALGLSAEYRTVASLFGVGRTTVGEIVLEFCDAVNSTIQNEYMSAYPPTQEKLEKIVAGFAKKGFLQCYGAADGTHFEVNPPKDEATDYYNYKGWHSVILFAVVDSEGSFTYINVGATGRNNDSYVFENSKLKVIHETDPIFQRNGIYINGIKIPVMLIGDSAFRLSRIMLKPYPFDVNASAQKKAFNYLLSKKRKDIEITFGQLKARFRKLGRGWKLVLKMFIYVLITACCLLHNFLLEERDSVLDVWMEEMHQVALTRTQPQHNENQQDDCTDGVLIRDTLAASFSG